MAGEASDVGAGIGLDAISGRATQTARSTYLALLTATPSDTTTMSTMTEITTPGSNGYSRQAVTWTTPALDSGVMATKNNATLTFGPFSSDLSNVTHCALVSASTGTSGDFLWWWSLDTARDPANGDSIQFAANALVMKLD